MTIVWNKVTWYSKLLAAIFFIFIIPILTFCIGRKYEQTRLELEKYKTSVVHVNGNGLLTLPSVTQNGVRAGVSQSAAVVTSGIFGESFVGKNSPYQGHLVVKDTLGNTITVTKVRPDGRFLLLLNPGQYQISAISSLPMPSLSPTVVGVQKDIIAKITLEFDGPQ